jgi:diadenylate cyclase
MSPPWPSSLAQLPLRSVLRSLVERIADQPWIVALELILIGSVVYTVLRFLQGTRGARLVRAVLTILAVSAAAVWIIADQFDSERIKLLYPYFLLAVFLVSLVAFQTELRRMLLKVGEGGWLQRLMRSPEPAIEAVVEAVDRLSTRRIGAIIAIERGAELEAVIESGVKLDAVVSPELLETIFWPGTPLHDLGVIVQHGRVTAAGCQFPLADSEAVDRTMGSRHRAALGLSEETDAIVVVVSEETGRISVAVSGRFHRNLTPGGLRDILNRELGAAPAPVAETDATKSSTASSTLHGAA